MSRRLLIRLGIGAAFFLPILYFSTSMGGTNHVDYTDHSSTKFGNAQTRGLLSRYSTQWSGSVSEESCSLESGNTAEKDWDVVDLSTRLPPTKYEGGLPGYTIWSNLYLSSSTLIAIKAPSHPIEESEGDEGDEEALGVSGEREWPIRKFIMSDEHRKGVGEDSDRWRVVDEGVGRGEVGKRAVRFKGVTYVFNDGPGKDGYLVFYKHFVIEAFLGAVRSLASVLPATKSALPNRIWFPRCGQEPSWRDDKGENAWFLAHALPGVPIEDANAWDDRASSGLTVLLDKVVIVDRWAAHSVGKEVAKWNKMNTDIPTLPAPKGFWDPIRENMMSTLGVDQSSTVKTRGLPVVVYIDRQRERPRLRAEDHEGLINALKGLTGIAEVHVAKLGGMKKDKQVGLMGRAEVVIGLHGDELLGSLWMPETGRSSVIEVMEEGGFVRDHEVLATSLGHKYMAVWNDRVLEEAEWRALGAKRGEGAQGEIPVDGAFIAKLVRSILEKDP